MTLATKPVMLTPTSMVLRGTEEINKMMMSLSMIETGTNQTHGLVYETPYLANQPMVFCATGAGWMERNWSGTNGMLHNPMDMEVRRDH